ncbi:fibronectin type III domain-containing protein [Dyella monticola]|uniref:fibronectin type III domain-containing protein n=1 Tax=Dyella monticola TaxID=1927958 RepID=UPI001314DFB8|nr:fibronectin type III domain-containing protein [Dyella monticola]
MAWALGTSGLARSQSTVTPDQEYQQLIKVNQDIQPLGANPFGENISPYNGELSFEETDVSLAGNGPAIVIARSLSTTNPLSYSFDADRPFADWDLDIPRIETVVVAKIQGGNTGWITSGLTIGSRCSNFSPPAQPSPTKNGDEWYPDQWWYGYHLIVPGEGSQDLMTRAPANALAPAAGTSTYSIITKQNWMIACTASNAADDGGQGFIALAPDGTQYTFTHLVLRSMTTLDSGGTGVGGLNPLQRNDAFMYVTQVVDRFGNSLTYSYNNTNGNLTSITASDGRSVTINYDSTGFLITSITANTSGTNVAPRTWTYAYNTSNPDLPTLTSVSLPDGSAWSYNLGAFQTTPMTTIASGDCSANNLGTVAEATVTGTITHPSGLTGTFTLQVLPHGRSYVQHICWGPTGSGTDSPYYQYPEQYYQPTITSKSFSGAGVPAETWSYNYSAANASSTADACAASGTCASTVWTDVTDPNGNDVVYSYSNKWGYTEGQLLSTTYYSGAAAGNNVLRTETNTYANPTGGPWPTQYGEDLQDRNNIQQTTELAPLQIRQTQEEGDTYTWSAAKYDNYAHPIDVTRSNSIGGQQPIEETTTYLDDPNLWVLDPVVSVLNNTTGETELFNKYDTGTDLLIKRYRFGELMMTYSYDNSGQLLTFMDGDSNVTALGNYKLGVPQEIDYPDGGTELLTVDDLRQITSITDQNNNTTQYSYDPIGRIQQITYPTNDKVSWYPKTFSYTFVNSAERGIAAGHWDRVTTVGNAVTTTYFDTKLRPILSDTSNGSQDITTATSYDWTGATTFASYPVYGQPAITGLSTGTHHTYDALERETLTQEDSELGSLSTTTAYLSGAGKQVTDPKGNVTTTYYQVFDEPDYKDPVSVSAPGGVTQLIARDIYGNPTSITQSGAYGSENDSVTKTLAYDSVHRLCAISEPESGTTLMGYDPANNLAWSIQGQPPGSACVSTQPANATTRSYDPMNRVLTIQPPAGTQVTNYQYDAVGNIVFVSSQTNGTGGTQQAFTYDTRNLLTTEALGLPGAGYTWAMGYAYDAYGHASAVAYPSYNNAIETVVYSPDALGRATQVSSYATGISYFPNNQVAGFTYGSGASYTAQQNTRQLLSNFSDGMGGSAAINEGYTYDANGNITNVADDVPNGTRGKTFTYDALNRLTSATASGLYGVESYTYDALNNLRSRVTGGNTLTLNYNASNQLASVSEGATTTTVYGYDNQGNRNSLSSGGATTTYNFDVENQLLNVSGVESYFYDAAGRRVTKTNTSGAVSAYYMYDQAGQLMYEFDPATATGTNYVYLGTKLIAKDVMQQVEIPTGVTTSPANPTAGTPFTVSWNAVPDATSYTLQTTNGLSGTTTVYNGSATSTTQTLTTGGAQWYQLNACSSAGCSGWAAVQVAVWPGIPTFGPLPTGTDNGGYTVSWSAPPGADTYDVGVSTDGGTTWTALATGTTSNSIAQPGNVTGSYTYRVQAHNRQVTGTAGWAVSPVVTVNTSYGVTPTPTPTLSVPGTSYSGSATISWTAASPVTSYTLQQSANGGSTWATVPLTGTTSANVTGLAAGSYVYQLQACNTAGGGNACTSWVAGGPMVVTLPPSPAPTASVQTVNSNSGIYIVDWSGNNEATSYTVQMQVNGGAWTTVQTSTGTAYDATGQTDATYAYRVEACNVAGCSGWSNTVTTTVLLPPGASSLSGGGTSNTGSYGVSWSAVATATSYTLQESVNSGAYATVQSSGATSWSTSGRGNGTYQYRVQACNGGGCGPWSNVVTETVTLIPGTPLPSITLTGSTSKYTMHVSWSAMANATSYKLEMKSTAENGTVTSPEPVYTGSATTFSEIGNNEVTYDFQVQACNSTGCSAWSEWSGIFVP